MQAERATGVPTGPGVNVSHQVLSEVSDELPDFGWYLGWAGDLHVTLAVHTMFVQSVPLCSGCTQVLEVWYSIGCLPVDMSEEAHMRTA